MPMKILTRNYGPPALQRQETRSWGFLLQMTAIGLRSPLQFFLRMASEYATGNCGRRPKILSDRQSP